MSNTTGTQNTAVGNTIGNDNVAVGNTSVVQNVAVVSVEAEISIASSDINTTSDADQIADKIIAANIVAQQEAQQEEQEDTGQYGDESKLIALIGYVPDFNNYSKVTIPDSQEWYSSQTIYTSDTIEDNVGAFYGLVNENLKGLSQMMNDQPNIWR